jgi:5-methylcytosine-specific restriction endonuclease McrA
MTKSPEKSKVKTFVPPKAVATKAAGQKVAGSKAPIPKALREQVWVAYAGRCFERKCLVPWCQNTMSVFDFHVGHDVPESEGGATELRNLRPICARCNLSMGAQYSIQEWARISQPAAAVPAIEKTGCCWWPWTRTDGTK